MLGECEGVKTFSYGSLHYFFKGVLRMAAELARMAVMGVRHIALARDVGTFSPSSTALAVKVDVICKLCDCACPASTHYNFWDSLRLL
jgi:hypothetical protein